MVTKIIQVGYLLQICFLLFQCAPKAASNISKSPATALVDSSKGSEIEKVVALANAFKSLLTAEQIKTLQLGWSKTDAAKWSNFPQAFAHPQRVGISFSQLDTAQIKAAKALMIYVLDDKTLNEGFDEAEGIMAADDLLGSLPGKSKDFGSGNYYIAFL